MTAAIEGEAHALAESFRPVRSAPSAGAIRLEHSPSKVARALDRARKRFLTSELRTEEPTAQKAAEWFLDNHYLVRRVARQVTEDLSLGVLRRLPLLASGVARIDALAQALVARSSIEIDVTALEDFIQAYQDVSVLTIAELWVLPTMLRLSVLDGLLRFLEEPGAGDGIERSIRALRLLAEIDWKAFFERTSRVERILRSDPATAYEQMDFATSDLYRKTVEELAWATGVAEEAVAEHAIELARPNDPRSRLAHVGYYLVDDGRRALEERVHYRPRGLAWVRRAVTNQPTAMYLSGLALATVGPLVALAWALARDGARPLSIAIRAVRRRC